MWGNIRQEYLGLVLHEVQESPGASNGTEIEVIYEQES